MIVSFSPKPEFPQNGTAFSRKFSCICRQNMLCLTKAVFHLSVHGQSMQQTLINRNLFISKSPALISTIILITHKQDLETARTGFASYPASHTKERYL